MSQSSVISHFLNCLYFNEFETTQLDFWGKLAHPEKRNVHLDLLLKKHDYADELIEQLQNLSVEGAAEIEACGEFGVDLSWETGEAFDAGQFSAKDLER